MSDSGVGESYAARALVMKRRLWMRGEGVRIAVGSEEFMAEAATCNVVSGINESLGE